MRFLVSCIICIIVIRLIESSRYEFCWICSGPYRRCKCGGSTIDEADEEPAVVFDRLNRRCLAHAVSRDSALAVRDKCLASLSTIRDMTKTQWLTIIADGFKAVASCRNAISYSCVRLHALKSESTAKTLFQFALSELEGKTDSLHERLESIAAEHGRSPAKMDALKLDVLSLSRQLDAFLASFSVKSGPKARDVPAADGDDDADTVDPAMLDFPFTNTAQELLARG